MDKKTFEPKAMNENFAMLEKRLLDILDSTDIESVNAMFAEITEPTIIIGSGGSSVACQFLANLIAQKNENIVVSKLPDEVLHMNVRPYRNVVAVSYSGANWGVKNALDYAKESGLKTIMLTASETAQTDEIIHYGHTEKSEDSFISFAGTMAPMVVGLAYYLGDKEKAKIVIQNMFEKIESQEITAQDGNIFEIIGKEAYPAAAAFVESALSESSIGVPVTSGKYDECHGRSTSVLRQEDRQIIYFMDKESELDQMWHERLGTAGVGDRVTDVTADYNDTVVNDFYLTLYMAHWVKDLATQKGVDLSTMSDETGKRIHLPADYRAIELWEAEHDKSFWAGRPDWRGLDKVDAEERKSPGYYAPTGKFYEGGIGFTGTTPDLDDPQITDIVKKLEE